MQEAALRALVLRGSFRQLKLQVWLWAHLRPPLRTPVPPSSYNSALGGFKIWPLKSGSGGFLQAPRSEPFGRRSDPFALGLSAVRQASVRFARLR